MVLAREQWLPLKHLGENAARAPNVHLYIVLLPREHDLRCSVVSRRDVAGHLRVLYTRQAEVADFEVAVFVDEDVGGFEIAVDDAGGVDVFEAALQGVSKSGDSGALQCCLLGSGRGSTG